MADEEAASSVEAQFARRLAANEKKIRDKALKKLKKYVSLRSQRTDGGFNRDEMLRIWKGLFYCMWMSDKPLVQEELSKNISDLMLDISNTKTAMLFFDVFLQTMEREWRGIDRLRMDKFYMLVRNMLEKGFEFLKQQEWDVGVIDWMLAIMKNGPISPSRPMSGMHFHFCDIYLEELAKVTGSTLSQEVLLRFLDPYCIFITQAKNYDLVKSAVEEVFQQLVENSKPALDLLAEEEDDEILVDIRSHTQMPGYDSSPITGLNINYSALADRIYSLASEKGVLARNRRKAFALVEKFRELAEGRLPLTDVPDAEYSSGDEIEMLEDHLATEIVNEDMKEFDEKQELRREKRKRRRKRKTAQLQIDSDDDKMPDEDEAIQHETNVEDDFGSSEKHLKVTENQKKKRKTKRKKNNNTTKSDSLNHDLQPPSQVVENVPKSEKASEPNSGPKIAAIENKEDSITANMPDLIQDVARSDCEVKNKKKSTKPGKEKYYNVRKWLATESSDSQGSNSDYIPVVAECANGLKRDEKRPKNKRKKSHTSSTSSVPQKKKDNHDEETIIAVLDKTPFVKASDKEDMCKSRDSKSSDVAADRANSEPAAATFIRFAASKVQKAAKNKHLAAVKRRAEELVTPHSPKRVVFEMSKTQVKPFRKMDKAIACSPTPNNVAFDPNKTPDFSLLKRTRSRTAGKHRGKASDFF